MENNEEKKEPIEILINAVSTLQASVLKMQEDAIAQQKMILELQDIIHTNAKHINAAFTIIKALTDKYTVVLESNT